MQNPFDKKEMSLSRPPPFTNKIVFNSLSSDYKKLI